jgi:23S rRNA pseudouridine1911/1915/1917 synthase
MMSEVTLDFQVTSENEGKRIDQFLAQVEQIRTRSRAEFLIDSGRVFLNGKRAKSSSRLKTTDHIQVQLPNPKSTEIQSTNIPLDIVYEDSDLIVVNKPSGLVVHPAHGHESDTLVNALLHYTRDLSLRFGEERPGIVHRIDKETSGLLVVAKNDRSHENLSQQFKDKTTHRIYEALVFGQPTPIEGHITSYLARHPTERKKFASIKIWKSNPSKSPSQGKYAGTYYRILKKDQALSLLELKLETGRTHQIRVHLSEKGHPLVGDSLYGGDKKWKALSPSWKEKFKAANRFFLHAKELGFAHPTTKEFMLFRKDWPPDELELIHEYFARN